MISDSQKPEISGLSTANAYKYKTKMKQRQKKKHFRWLVTSVSLYLKGIAVPLDHKQVKKIET